MIREIFLSVFPFSIVFIMACNMQNNIACTKQLQLQTVNVGEVPITYFLPKGYIDKSSELTIERWGPDFIKKFVEKKDTLTLSWYYPHDEIDYSAINKIITNRIGKDSNNICDNFFEKEVLGVYDGMYCEIHCGSFSKLIFYGIDTISKRSIMVEYKVENIDASNKFHCFMKSFM